VFSFIVAKFGNPHLSPVPAQRMPANRDMNMLKAAWQRIWSAESS
jgi:hypothetical protein